MIGRHRNSKVQPSAELQEAQDQLADAQQKERAARQRMAVVLPKVRRLEHHLADNGFGQMMYDLIKGPP
jgi:hypothetical protein